MDYKEAIQLFEETTKKTVVQIERCGIGIANYVFLVSTEAEKFVLRCSREEDAYEDTVHWLGKLSVCGIPIPAVLFEGKYGNYSYLVLSYIPGDDIGNVYHKLSDSQKKQIAGEVIEIQRKVSKIHIRPDAAWTWNGTIRELLDRAEERMQAKQHFDSSKIAVVRTLQHEIQAYLDHIQPIPYLDDISTKNLLICEGRLSGIIDIDWMGFGDMLTFVAMTKVALLNMDLDTRYIDYLLEEIHPDTAAYKAFVFYCLVYCVDFMGERGMQFLDKTIPVNESVVRKLNHIFDTLLEEWEGDFNGIQSSHL